MNDFFERPAFKQHWLDTSDKPNGWSSYELIVSGSCRKMIMWTMCQLIVCRLRKLGDNPFLMTHKAPCSFWDNSHKNLDSGRERVFEQPNMLHLIWMEVNESLPLISQSISFSSLFSVLINEIIKLYWWANWAQIVYSWPDTLTSNEYALTIVYVSIFVDAGVSVTTNC